MDVLVLSFLEFSSIFLKGFRLTDNWRSSYVEEKIEVDLWVVIEVKE